MLKLTGTNLRNFDIGNEGKDNVCRVSLLEMGFDAKGIGSIYNNAGMLRGDDGFDDGGKIVDVRQSLDT